MRAWLLAGLALVSLNQASDAQPSGDTVARIRTCLGYERTTRQKCFDALWQELTVDAAFPAQAGEVNWIVSETMSPLDYSPQIVATKVTRLTSGNAPSLLTVGCRQRRTDISIGTTGVWKPLSADEVKVAYRINSQPEVEERWAPLVGGRSAYFRGDAARLLNVLPDPGQLGVRVYDGPGPTPQATFKLAGLDPVRQKITAACKSAPGKGSPPPEWR